MAEKTSVDAEEEYPGERLGLPETGQGSLASWRSRIAALIFDWAVSMAIAVVFFGRGVLTESDWRSWMILAVFFVQTGTGTMLFGSSVGQLLAKIAVVRLDREPLGPLRAYGRALLVCLVLPPLVIGADRRGLHDLAAGTAVINRR
ncbi:RDD family protein [Microlunatus ginsengisoli]|uniref:RDD family protein n=1 Tax=Microlunatus ginsengisoli TaxID=363863 RepID=UPI0031DACF05